MSGIKTAVTEIVTGLGLLGYSDLERALSVRPRSILRVDDEVYDELEVAYDDGKVAQLFSAAWANGVAFAASTDGLRGRPPWRVEWRGPDRPPAYEQIPADLRVDHVYLLSCKYGSNILQNASPGNLFDRALAQRERASVDWFQEVAPESFQSLYADVRDWVGFGPPHVTDLASPDRKLLKDALTGSWPPDLDPAWRSFAAEVGDTSAKRLIAAVSGRKDAAEILSWRLLRLQAAPYFVLGETKDHSPLRFRVSTPSDFRARFAFRSFDVWGDAVGQPLVRWRVDVHDRELDVERVVEGHVEIRWSHGKFGGMPEAKIYLDTPHHEVAGYEPLDDGS